MKEFSSSHADNESEWKRELKDLIKTQVLIYSWQSPEEEKKVHGNVHELTWEVQIKFFYLPKQLWVMERVCGSLASLHDEN